MRATFTKSLTSAVKDLKMHEWSHQRDVRNFKFACGLCSKKSSTRIRWKIVCCFTWMSSGAKNVERNVASRRNSLNTNRPIWFARSARRSSSYMSIFDSVLRPYKCGICDENFTQRSSMMRHRKTHTGTVPAPPSISFVKLAKSVLQVLRGSNTVCLRVCGALRGKRRVFLSHVSYPTFPLCIPLSSSCFLSVFFESFARFKSRTNASSLSRLLWHLWDWKDEWKCV